jgi:hypothetical protein
MATREKSAQAVTERAPLHPAEPLWRLAPTRSEDGRSLADFMMLIPTLATGGESVQRHVGESIRGVCESFGDAVAFAEVNYRLNILWVSVAAEPGLSGRVASAIRQQLPDALLVGGQLGVVSAMPQERGSWRAWWRLLRVLPAPAIRRLAGGKR